MTLLAGRKGLLLGAAALFLLLSIVYCFSIGIKASRGASITGDEPFYLLTTQSLVQDGDLALDSQYQARSYEAFFDHPAGLWRQSVPTEDGRLLSPHNPGLSILVIPGFVLGSLLGVQIQLLVMAAATMALAFLLAARLTGMGAISWLAALGVGLTAIAFIHSTEIYPEFPAALALVAALLIVAWRKELTQTDGVLLMALLSAMCWVGVKYVPLAAVVGGVALLRSGARTRAALLGLGGVSAAFFIWFHLKTYGALTPYNVGAVYWGMTTAETLGHHVGFEDRIYRLWGLFVDRRFGIGRWAPLLLAVIPGLALMARSPVHAHRTVLGLIVVQLLIAAFVVITMMGYWFPGRTLLTVLPLFVVPMTLVIAALPAWGRGAVGVLGLYTLVVSAGLAHAGHTGEVTIAVDPFDMSFPPFQGLSVLFPDYRSWTVETWGLTVMWLVAGGASIALALRPGWSLPLRKVRLGLTKQQVRLRLLGHRG